MRLYLDGGLQFSTRDEYRYTESLVYPALGKGARSVLVLGGGDGLAARELLRQPGVETIVQVELDPAVIELARTTMREANGGSLNNPRVKVVIDDAMRWLRAPHPELRPPAGFDAVIVDLPDPDTPVLGRLYSTEFYELVSHALAPGGLMVVQAGSPFSTQTAFWRTVSSIQAAGYAVTPYHVYVPTFGDWGFVLARRGDAAPTPSVPADAPPLRFLEPAGTGRRHRVLRRRPAAPACRRRHWTIRASSTTCGTGTTYGHSSSSAASTSSDRSTLVQTFCTSSLSSSASTSLNTLRAPSTSTGTLTEGWKLASADS